VRTAGYMSYADQLRKLAARALEDRWSAVQGEVHSALNGQAAQRLRTLVPLTVRREEGAFFTGGDVRQRFAQVLRMSADGAVEPAVYWDPACGAGDLLLAAVEQLPLKETLSETLAFWGASIRGCDLQPAFVETTKLRLFLAAVSRHRDRGDVVDVCPSTGVNAFQRVRVADAHELLGSARSVRVTMLMNPPFGSMQAQPDWGWTSGAVSQAAVLALAAAESLANGHRMVAILPDVLRSGSRYARWRSELESLVQIEQIETYGQFDAHTDVDVFIISAARRRKRRSLGPSPLWWPETRVGVSVGDMFEVRVGAVVDNRDPHSGPVVPYLTARGLGVGAAVVKPDRQRAFAGRLVTPPFVAIRRTSRPGVGPGGTGRAAGVLVSGEEPVAVDNHVIVIKPRGDGGEEECRRLISILDTSETSRWLDARIRCRHLTVGVVRAIPWPQP
jgi:hypothetical protein